MRWLVWSLAGLLSSCAKSSSSPNGSGGRMAEAGRVGGGVGGGGGGGGIGQAGMGGTAPLDAGNGGSGAYGGTSSAGSGSSGGSGSGGVPSAGSSGGDPQSGAAGSAGEGAAGEGNPPVECGGRYLECRCGCSSDPSSTPSDTRCYYPERGETLEAIEAKDQEYAMSSACPDGTVWGGIEHLCCAAPEATGTAVYEATGYIGGLNQISLTRTDPDKRCTRAHFTFPNTTESKFPLELPANWGLQLAADCGGRTGTTQLIGALGSLVFTSTDPCTVSFDFTVFLASDSGEVEAVRFQSEAEVSGLSSC